ncbi:MAG TPA: ATP-dependent Clp protease ATP-binding subunit, partial [Roseburia sp.]|nr:ATP-dependent Clp protease ATP-binding subunit [Roseburia sp.]
VLAEVAKAGNVLLFIDEIHTIIGAGGAEGAIDASNILKPALARGEVQVIGATTIEEYRKYIEKDAALER